MTVLFHLQVMPVSCRIEFSWGLCHFCQAPFPLMRHVYRPLWSGKTALACSHRWHSLQWVLLFCRLHGWSRRDTCSRYLRSCACLVDQALCGSPRKSMCWHGSDRRQRCSSSRTCTGCGAGRDSCTWIAGWRPFLAAYKFDTSCDPHPTHLLLCLQSLAQLHSPHSRRRKVCGMLYTRRIHSHEERTPLASSRICR